MDVREQLRLRMRAANHLSSRPPLSTAPDGVDAEADEETAMALPPAARAAQQPPLFDSDA